nr:WYL domain-containing protein [Frankia sp. ArI3]
MLPLGYQDAGGRTSEREAEPAGLLTAGGRWYLVAWCRLRRAPPRFPARPDPRRRSDRAGGPPAGARRPARLGRHGRGHPRRPGQPRPLIQRRTGSGPAVR